MEPTQPQHPHTKFCLLFDNSRLPESKTQELKNRITISEFSDKCVTILRFFPDYLHKWDQDRKRKFISFIIEDELEFKANICDVLPTIDKKLNDVDEIRRKLLPRCDQCGEYVYDPVRLPSGELIDRNCIDIFDKMFSTFASPVTDISTLNHLNQVEYTMSVAIQQKTPNRTTIFSYSTTYGQKIGFVLQSLIERYPEISSYQFYTEKGNQITPNSQDIINRISGIYVIKKTIVNLKDKILLKTDNDSEKSVKIQPWWMFYHLMDHFHKDTQEFSHVQVTLQLQNHHAHDYLAVESSKFVKSLVLGIECVKIKHSYRCSLFKDIRFTKTMKDLYIDYLNHFLYVTDKSETLIKSDAFTISIQGIIKVMSNNQSVCFSWDQTQGKNCNLLDALEYVIHHSNGYQTIILFLLNDYETDDSFNSLVDIENLNQRILVFIPDVTKSPTQLNNLQKKFPTIIQLLNLYDFHDEINKLY